MSGRPLPTWLHTLRSVMTNTGLRVAGAALGFLATFIVTTTLGPAHAGILFATLTWAAALVMLARWGVIDRILIEGPTPPAGRQALSAARCSSNSSCCLLR